MGKKRKQRLSQYPTHWLTLVTRVASGKDLVVEFSEWSKASTFRFRFYHFREALGLEAEKNPVHKSAFQDAELITPSLIPVNPCEMPGECKQKRIDTLCSSCQGPTKVRFSNRDIVSEGAIIAKALAKLDSFEEDKAGEELLRTITGETPNG